MNRQQKLLSILLGVFALALIYGVATYPRRERVTSGPPRGAVRAPELPVREKPSTIPEKSGLPSVEEGEAGAGSEVGIERNIFEPLFPFEAPPVPAVPGMGSEGEAGPVVELLPPPPPFELLGYLEKNQGQIIFLTRNDELFIVKPEERFGENDRYRIIEAGREKVVLEESGKGESTSLFFAEDDTGDGRGGRPFSRIDPRLQGPPAGRELSLPEPSEDFGGGAVEPDAPPTGLPPGVTERPTEVPDRSPLAPGLIVPEETSTDGKIPEEDAAPSIDEVVDE